MMDVSIPSLARELATYARQLDDGMKQRVKRCPDIADYLPQFEKILRLALLPDAKTQPGGNKPMPPCEQCAHELRHQQGVVIPQAAFIINDRALCHRHRPPDFAPPSLREKT